MNHTELTEDIPYDRINNFEWLLDENDEEALMQRALELSMRDMSTEEVVNVQSRHAPISNSDEEDEVS